MNGVPESAAVNEAVKLAAKNRNPAVKSFVNGLLRSFLRAEKKLPEYENRVQRLAFEYSCPPSLVEKWIDEYGEKTAVTLLKSSLGRPPVTVKVNTLKTTPEQLAEILGEEGFGARVNSVCGDCLDIIGSAPESTQAYRDGFFHVQDISSRLCCHVLDPKPDMTVLDLCSAPGGKTFTSAEIMENKGDLRAFDLHENRVRLIRNGAKRLGLEIINASANNAKVFNAELPQADRVLCDVPCSGFGVIRRKPEIKYKNPSDFDRLPDVQYEILDTCSRYVKVGGTLIYSTCTVSRAENDGVAEKFLENHSEFCAGTLPEPLGGGSEDFKVTITPDRFNSDGFFIAKFVRMR
jgi:16S rRNA (cytosine967-C5)-methyltransferase